VRAAAWPCRRGSVGDVELHGAQQRQLQLGVRAAALAQVRLVRLHLGRQRLLLVEQRLHQEVHAQLRVVHAQLAAPQSGRASNKVSFGKHDHIEWCIFGHSTILRAVAVGVDETAGPPPYP